MCSSVEVSVRMGKEPFVGLFRWYRLELWPDAAPFLDGWLCWVGVWETWQLNNVALGTMPITWKGLLSGHCGNDSDGWGLGDGNGWESKGCSVSQDLSNAVTLRPEAWVILCEFSRISQVQEFTVCDLMESERSSVNAWVWALWWSWFTGC